MKTFEALSFLLSSQPMALGELPNAPGLYALHDHLGLIRYIGVTDMGIYRRIFQYHVAGDGNSHKYSSAYNAGKMWYDRKKQMSGHDDGAISKDLRRRFARKYCRASALPLENLTRGELFQLESQVRALAPREVQTWNDRRSVDVIEPETLVEALLKELKWPDIKVDAVLRQSERWKILAKK